MLGLQPGREPTGLVMAGLGQRRIGDAGLGLDADRFSVSDEKKLHPRKLLGRLGVTATEVHEYQADRNSRTSKSAAAVKNRPVMSRARSAARWLMVKSS